MTTHHAHHTRELVSHHNVGGWERGTRLFLGAVLTGTAAAVGAIWLRLLLAAIGLAGLVTSVEGYCPVNRAIGRDSYHHPQP
ncbi:MAG TPA: DUF2892 domain-containing protein [Elusimicrobiota bacterium]|jgi:hypothetical protein|nr:DUF2892 domain-containing protein [Elusimicrobiota bacterium]